MTNSIRLQKASQYCDIEAFKSCAKKVGGDVEQLMLLLEKTNRLTCEYFLPWQDSFEYGGTAYIDGVRPTSVSNSVQWGIDPYARVFMTFHFIETPGATENQTSVVFQRYTLDSLLVRAGHFHCSEFFTVGPMNKSDMKKIDILLSKGSMSYQSRIYGNEITLTLTSPK